MADGTDVHAQELVYLVLFWQYLAKQTVISDGFIGLMGRDVPAQVGNGPDVHAFHDWDVGDFAVTVKHIADLLLNRTPTCLYATLITQHSHPVKVGKVLISPAL